VTRAKYAISRLRPVQGRLPLRPMPICWVAATMRVSSGRAVTAVAGLGVGIFFFLLVGVPVAVAASVCDVWMAGRVAGFEAARQRWRSGRLGSGLSAIVLGVTACEL
jgi:hypothetical protein